MKRVIALKPFNNKVFYRNAVFDETSAGSAYLIAARKLLEKNDIRMDTIDIVSDTDTLKDIYMDVPYPWELNFWVRIIKNSQKSILFIVETPIVNPFNFIRIFQLFFSKIYTWNDDLVDNVKYFKYQHPKSKVKKDIELPSFKNKKLLILMNGNLAPFLPFQLLSLSTKELYTKRIEAIDFYDNYYPADFNLYGRGWNKPRRFSLTQRLFGFKKYNSYKGEFPQQDKYKILSKFKFSLCFENCQATGYISEKIFDCFKGGCVPIYLGAPNVTDYISSKCFIDYRKFKNYQELTDFLYKMDENTYNSYLTEIKALLHSKEFLDRWSTDAFAKIFQKAILG